MEFSEIFAAIKNAVQMFVIDTGFINPDFAWLKELLATIMDWFATLF